MNIALMRLKPVVRELRGIRDLIERACDLYEADLASREIYVRPPRTDTSGPEPTISYVDEEMDWVRENVARLKREDELKSRDDVFREGDD